MGESGIVSRGMYPPSSGEQALTTRASLTTNSHVKLSKLIFMACRDLQPSTTAFSSAPMGTAVHVTPAVQRIMMLFSGRLISASDDTLGHWFASNGLCSLCGENVTFGGEGRGWRGRRGRSSGGVERNAAVSALAPRLSVAGPVHTRASQCKDLRSAQSPVFAWPRGHQYATSPVRHHLTASGAANCFQSPPTSGLRAASTPPLSYSFDDCCTPWPNLAGSVCHHRHQFPAVGSGGVPKHHHALGAHRGGGDTGRPGHSIATGRGEGGGETSGVSRWMRLAASGVQSAGTEGDPYNKLGHGKLVKQVPWLLPCHLSNCDRCAPSNPAIGMCSPAAVQVRGGVVPDIDIPLLRQSGENE